jgi:dipeptidyl aminopeptidase/acylaminoacyl peptidase
MEVGWAPRSLLADNRTVYLIDSTNDAKGNLRTLDLETGALGEIVFTPPAGEILSLILSPGRRRLLGVVYEDDKIHTHWIDERWKMIGRTLDAQFPGQSIHVASISRDEKRFVLLTSSDRDPGTYYLIDTRGEGLRAQPLSGVRPAIKPEAMSPMEPIQFSARDGLTIHGYLTKPGGVVNAHTPLLVMPHGGPIGLRDSWGFDNEVQFLANRGYAVLQVNFRGSRGYGPAFLQAGFKEWGGKMQDDLTDAVKWVIAQGWADADRVGIIGASYGGYAALAGVTQTPELYKVGINYVGVSDLRLITRWDLGEQSAGARMFFESTVGRDPEWLKAHSPVEHVANIRVPTLHAYGKNDPRVEFSHWEALEKALKKSGKEYEALIEEAEGHGFEKEEAAFRFYSAVEKFLAKHMPAGD